MRNLRDKIRILYVITGLTAGGAELNLSKLINNLDQNHFESHVCSLTNTKDILPLIIDKISSIFLLNATKSSQFIRIAFQVRKIIKKVDPDIIHCIMFHSNMIGRFAAFNLNKIVISSIRTKLKHKKLGNLFDFLTQPLVNYYFVNSKSLLNFISHYGIQKNKIHLMENGINFELFNPNKSKEEIKNELGLANVPIICTVANFKKQKDYPTIIKAMNLLKNKMEFCYLIAGSGLQFEDNSVEIKELVEHYALSNVKFLGFRNDVANILSISDVWVNSSIFEGQSNSLLEAMAMKLPIITTDIDENREIVRHNQEAILIPIQSPHVLAKSIESLLKNKQFAEDLANRAFLRVKKNYDNRYHMHKMMNFYDKICLNIT